MPRRTNAFFVVVESLGHVASGPEMATLVPFHGGRTAWTKKSWPFSQTHSLFFFFFFLGGGGGGGEVKKHPQALQQQQQSGK